MRKLIPALVIIAIGAVSITAIAAAIQPRVGGDRDTHGCIPSAGYRWCEAKKKCVRSFEEPCAVASSARYSSSYNYKDRDIHGCRLSLGYKWCEAKQKCYRPLLETCKAPSSRPSASERSVPCVGCDRDAHGCIPSAGYKWCEAKKKCYRWWEEPCR